MDTFEDLSMLEGVWVIGYTFVVAAAADVGDAVVVVGAEVYVEIVAGNFVVVGNVVVAAAAAAEANSTAYDFAGPVVERVGKASRIDWRPLLPPVRWRTPLAASANAHLELALAVERVDEQSDALVVGGWAYESRLHERIQLASEVCLVFS